MAFRSAEKTSKAYSAEGRIGYQYLLRVFLRRNLPVINGEDCCLRAICSAPVEMTRYWWCQKYPFLLGQNLPE